MILAYTFFALVGLGQSPAFPAVRADYHTRAKLLPKVLAEISEKTGENLKCGMTLANEVVIMEVKDAPLSDLMPQLAEAVCGKWAKSKDEWILSLDANRARKEDQAEIAVRKPLFEKALKPYFETLDEPFGGKDADALIARMKANQPGADGGFSRAQMEALASNGARSPGGRAIGRALRSVDLTRLAAMQLGDRIVFSTHPTAAQIPLGASAKNLISELVKEQAIWSSARAGFPSQGARVGLLSIGDAYDQNPIVETPSKAILVVEQAPEYGTTSADFQLANREGKVIYRCRAELKIDSLGVVTAPEIPKSVKWSQRTEELLKDLQKNTAPQMQIAEPRVSEGWEKELSRCDLVDPLSYFTTDLFFAVGRSSSPNWIGVPEEENFGWSLANASRSLTTGEMPAKLYWHQINKSELSGVGWTLIRPANPASARRLRSDRKVLANFLEASRKSRSLSLDSMAEYVFRTGNLPSILSIVGILMNVMHREPNFGQLFQASKAALGFYGSLSVPQRRMLSQGGTLPVSQLMPLQSEWALKMFFEATPKISMQPLQKLGYDGEVNAHYLLGSTLRLEPTEVLNLGRLPGTATIRTEDTAVGSMMAVIEAEHLSYLQSDPLNVGRIFGQRVGSKQMQGTLAGFRLGEQRTLKLQVDATNTLQVVANLGELRYDYSKRLIPLSELPETIRLAYEKGYASGLEQGASFPASIPGRTPPPQ